MKIFDRPARAALCLAAAVLYAPASQAAAPLYIDIGGLFTGLAIYLLVLFVVFFATEGIQAKGIHLRPILASIYLLAPVAWVLAARQLNEVNTLEAAKRAQEQRIIDEQSTRQFCLERERILPLCQKYRAASSGG